MHVGGIKYMLWLSTCMGDDPLAKACGLSPSTNGACQQTMV